MLAVPLSAAAQQPEKKEYHGRKYKALAPAATITVVVEKAQNGKPISNAAVIFRAKKDGKDQGGLEIKTNPDGEAKIDIIEIGSHVAVQVIADGYATNSTEFEVPSDTKSILVKMEKPRAQVSAYQDNDGKDATRPVGVQEPPPVVVKSRKAPATAPVVIKPVDPTATQQTTSPSQPQ